MYMAHFPIVFFLNVTMQDLEAIGIDQLGFKLKLERALKLLPPLHIDIQVPVRLVISIDLPGL